MIGGNVVDQNEIDELATVYRDYKEFGRRGVNKLSQKIGLSVFARQ